MNHCRGNAAPPTGTPPPAGRPLAVVAPPTAGTPATAGTPPPTVTPPVCGLASVGTPVIGVELDVRVTGGRHGFGVPISMAANCSSGTEKSATAITYSTMSSL